MLKQAHAIEIGAYHAYEGHCKSLPIDSDARRRIRIIQAEEVHHRKMVALMLRMVGSKPSRFLDSVLFVIGKTISFACHVMSRKMAMRGAKIMERLGDVCYVRIANEARSQGEPVMAYTLEEMAKAEQAHEEYFKEETES